MIECPIDYYVDNIIFNADKSCWAVFALTGFDYDFLSKEGKINILHKTTRFLTGIMTEAQFLIIPVEQDIKEHFNNLRKKVNKNDPLYNQSQIYSNLTEEYLKESIQARGATNDYTTYIAVKLETQEEAQDVLKIKEKYDFFMKNPINAVNVFFNLDTRDILQSKIKTCIKMANKWFKEQSARINLVELDTEEVQWLFRRMPYRGLNKSPKLFYKSQDKKKKWQPKAESLEIASEPILRPLKKDIVNLFSGQIRTNNRVVTIETEDTISYQTFLVLTNIPDEMDFPGCEWIYRLQKYDAQAEICVHIKATEYREGLHKLDLKKREIDSQIEHVTESNGEISEELSEGKEYAYLLESELKENRFPMLNTSIAICLAAGSRDLLEEKVSIVKNDYEDMNFGIERPLTDQRKLFMQFIPSVGVMAKDYVKPLTPRALAGGIIGATHQLGDNQGAYIGTTGEEEKHVYLDMGIACLKNKSASATFFGNLGFGKSFNANLLVVLNVIYGGYALIFDPKGERSHWQTDLKILDGLITTITLSSDPKFKGMLDPYNVYKEDINLANELAINIVTELFKLSPSSDDYTALLEAVRVIKIRASEGITPSMMELSNILNSFNEADDLYKTARKLSRRMSLQKENGMAHLIFGDGTEESLKIENRMNILQIQNMKLPSPEAKKEEYTAEETLSTVLMMIQSHFAKKFALVPRTVFTEILFDESWALGKTVEGAKLFDFLSRMGRSLFTGCIFNGHSVLDIPNEGIKNTISYKFCFQTGNVKEAERMLEYLNLENTPDNRDIIMNLENGTCLFQDLNKHVGILKFDAVFQDIIDVFSTTPTTEVEESEDKQKDLLYEIPEVNEILLEEVLEEATDELYYHEPTDNIDIYQREEI